MYERFEQLLKERKLSVAEFSRQTGISKSTLSDWKKGKFQLKDSKRRIIADYFGVSLDYLDGLTDYPAKESVPPDAFAGAIADYPTDWKERYYTAHQTYDIALRISDDPKLRALFERIEQDKEYKDRLFQIVELLEKK